MSVSCKTDLKSKTFCFSKSSICVNEKEINLVNIKLYQKIFVLLISFSTLLIFPESTGELEDICESNNSRKICNVW